METLLQRIQRSTNVVKDAGLGTFPRLREIESSVSQAASLRRLHQERLRGALGNWLEKCDSSTTVGLTCLWPQGLALAWSLGFLPALCAGRGLVRNPAAAAVFPECLSIETDTLPCTVWRAWGEHGG